MKYMASGNKSCVGTSFCKSDTTYQTHQPMHHFKQLPRDEQQKIENYLSSSDKDQETFLKSLLGDVSIEFLLTISETSRRCSHETQFRLV
jgi:hypothetical protein